MSVVSKLWITLSGALPHLPLKTGMLFTPTMLHQIHHTLLHCVTWHTCLLSCSFRNSYISKLKEWWTAGVGEVQRNHGSYLVWFIISCTDLCGVQLMVLLTRLNFESVIRNFTKILFWKFLFRAKMYTHFGKDLEN